MFFFNKKIENNYQKRYLEFFEGHFNFFFIEFFIKKIENIYKKFI